MMRKSRPRGFTLIELMVSITILGLGLTIIFLRIDSFIPSTRLQATCRKLVSDIDELRMMAVMIYKLPVRLEYDLEKHGYGAYLPFEIDDDQEIVGPGRTDLFDFRPLPVGVIFSDIRLGAQNMAYDDIDTITVFINPDGSVTGHIAHLKDEQYNKEYSMIVASLTGFSEVMDQRVEYEEIDESKF
ncbi:MAG: prepilin-type N-terminal cleavage/methylation domain-containing protein [Planctomycetes bacterium]|nr:prepilin-type N-terminal cleavage/methylation domain-containing protein [Planctomycetota bacterium]